MSVKINNLTKVYDNRKVLDDISLEIKDGEILSVVGFSGSGKSTLLKIISGLIEPDGGNFEVSEGDVAMVFQYSALFDSLNVYDNITFALTERKEYRKKYNKEKLNELVKEKLKQVGLEGIENKFPHELSGGMQKRVSFARAIVTNPKTILYDEPTSGLDPVSSTVIEDYILKLRNQLNSASIVVTHQMSTIKRCSNRVVMLYDGKMVFQGSVEELLSKQNPYAKQFVEASIEGPMKLII